MSKLTRISGAALALALTLSATSLAHAEDYGYDAESEIKCSVWFPVFRTFDDGSSGCFRADTPGLQEWAEGEFEAALALEEHREEPREQPSEEPQEPRGQRIGLPKAGY